MPNKLCEAACLGLPVDTSGAPDPTFPVVCRNGDMVIRAPNTASYSRQGGSDNFTGVSPASGQSVNGGYIQPTFNNPWSVPATALVTHELQFEAVLGYSDWWEFYLEVNITSGVIFGGATTGAFLMEKHNGQGSSLGPNAAMASISKRGTTTLLYNINPFTTFSIGMLGRLTTPFIGGSAPARNISQISCAMTIQVMPRYGP